MHQICESRPKLLAVALEYLVHLFPEQCREPNGGLEAGLLVRVFQCANITLADSESFGEEMLSPSPPTPKFANPIAHGVVIVIYESVVNLHAQHR